VGNLVKKARFYFRLGYVPFPVRELGARIFQDGQTNELAVGETAGDIQQIVRVCSR
jgi:hypothetical protein